MSEPIPDYGDLMTAEEYKDNVECGGFIDYDGYGNYSDGKLIYPKEGKVYPSEIKKFKKKYTHVVWYNR